jgi:hypothetical protein
MNGLRAVHAGLIWTPCRPHLLFARKRVERVILPCYSLLLALLAMSFSVLLILLTDVSSFVHVVPEVKILISVYLLVTILNHIRPH